MTQEPNKHGQQEPMRNDQAPQPPSGYDPNGQAQNLNVPPQPQGPQAEMQRLKKRITAAEIMAVVSLVIGGVLLSGAAVVLAIVTLSAISKYRYGAVDEREKVAWELLGRSAIIAIVVSVLAFALNAVTLAIVYPIVMEAVQTGDLSGLLGGGGAGGAKSSSVWG